MNRRLCILTTLILGCAKLPNGDSAADSTELADTGETNADSEDAGSGAADMDSCGPMPDDYVCVPADSEVDLDSVCSRCRDICSGAICFDEEEDECDENHAAFYAAEPSQTCIDLLIAAETCHFGLTCAELGEYCDPEEPCYPAWLAFHEAGCDTTVGIGPNCIWD